MTDTARPSAEAAATSLPDLVLYSRQGCHLCDEARALAQQILDERRAAGRPTPMLVERDIDTNPDWHAAHFATIPVLELGDQRLELATSAARIRRLIESV